MTYAYDCIVVNKIVCMLQDVHCFNKICPTNALTLVSELRQNCCHRKTAKYTSMKKKKYMLDLTIIVAIMEMSASL